MTLLVCRAIYHNILEFHARVLDGTGCGGGLVPRPISRLPSFTRHTSPNPARPTNLARCMNCTFPMHAACMHVHSLIPSTAPAADLPENIATVNAREVRFGFWPPALPVSEVVHQLFLSGKLFVTMSEIIGGAGFHQPRSQHAKTRVPTPATEVLANLRTVVTSVGCSTPTVARTRAEKSGMM